MVSRAHASIVSLAVVGGFLYAPTATGALLVVPDQYATIQSAIDTAASGDSVLIRDGTYHETLTLAGKDLTLFGETGYLNTIVSADSTGRVCDIGAGVTSATVISDVTFTKGLAERGAGMRITGGASPSLRRCRFFLDRAISASESYGGALLVESSSTADIEDCRFERNGAFIDLYTGVFGYGGAICALSCSHITVRGSRFESNVAAGFEGGIGGAIYVNEASATIEDCSFVSNFSMRGGAIAADGAVTVLRSVFESNTGTYGASAIACGSGAQCSPTLGAAPAAFIAYNLFYDNWTLAYGTLDVSGSGQVRNNTLAFNTGGSTGAGINVSDGVIVGHNIVANNQGVGIFCTGPGSPGLIACNDVWENRDQGPLANYGGACPDLTGMDDNISLDPLFCNAPARQLDLDAGSPCASGGVPCGLIGALAVGCDVTAVPAPGAESRFARLLPPRPNPGRGPVTIEFTLPRAMPVRLEIYDAAGRRVAELADRALEAGRHGMLWPEPGGRPARTSPGLYVVVLRAGGVLETRRLMLIR